MAKKDSPTVAKVIELARPVVESLGLTLWDVRFEKEGADWMLVILIDKDEGISIDDCEAVSRKLDPILDEADPIEQSYYLTVSSPGLGRELRKPHHFDFAMEQEIKLRLIRPDDSGRRDYRGVLTGYKDGVLTLKEYPDQTFSQSDCALIRLGDDEFGFDEE